MAGAPVGLPAGIRLSGHISLGVTAGILPPDLRDQTQDEQK
jgi:hypothetical protein